LNGFKGNGFGSTLFFFFIFKKNQADMKIPFYPLCCLLFSSFLLGAGCNRKQSQNVEDASAEAVDERCVLIPDPGNCRGAFPRFYYDQEEGQCKQFIWGGCGGVVPFETLADCQEACGVE
jgi:hypothetical protein